MGAMKAKCADIPITIRELRILKHTLGVDRYDRNGGRCPGEFYRNYFNAGSDSHGDYKELLALESAGLMKRLDRSVDSRGLGFVVTELGMELVREVVGSLFKCGDCGAEIVPSRPTICQGCANVEPDNCGGYGDN